MPTVEHCISINDIHEARERIAAHVEQTPLLQDSDLSKACGFDFYLKAENLQATGSFKARGATNAVFSLDESSASGGIVTHSSGNHAAAVARAGRLRGLQTHVIMPKTAPIGKIENVRSYGVEPSFCEPDAVSRQAAADQWIEKTGAALIHPYNDPATIAGQGTVGLEVLEQMPQPDCIVVCLGGGGLLSGVLIAVKTQRPEIKIIGAEPERADDAKRSLASGRIEMPVRYDSIADGLRTPLGERTFPIIRDLVDDVVLVSEDEIVTMTDRLRQATQTPIEPSGSVATAAAFRIQDRLKGQRVVATISGGNGAPSMSKT